MDRALIQHNYKASHPQNATVKVYAGLAAAALKMGEHMAYGLWCLARSLDAAGSGKVADPELREAAAGVGWSDFKYRRARHCALRLGMMHLSNDVLYLRSLEKAALALGADRVGLVPIGVSVEALATTKGWRAALRDVYLAQAKSPRPISRAAIQAVTGLSLSTQSRMNKINRQRVNVVHNFARLVKHFDSAHLPMAKEIEPSAYVKDGALWRSLPCTYDVSEVEYPRLPKGRSIKAQAALEVLRSIALVSGAIGANNLAPIAPGERKLSSVGERSSFKTARRYHETRESAFKALKAIGQGKRAAPDGEMYLLSGVRESTNTRGPRRIYAVWTAYPERDYSQVEA